jgi:hypothetical protein
MTDYPEDEVEVDEISSLELENDYRGDRAPQPDNTPAPGEPTIDKRAITPEHPAADE